MDISRGGINDAKSRVKSGSFCLGDSRTLPFKSGNFDYLISTEVLEHIVGNDAIRECYRVLKPNGIALITVPNGRGPGGRYFPYHIRLFTFKSLMTFLEEAGFEIVSGEKFGLYIPFVTIALAMLSQALGKNLPFSPVLNIKVPEFLATSFFIECRKPPE
jgi:SAM-dependent methyltransferase